MTTQPEIRRRIALGLSALAIIGMGSLTVACGSKAEKPASTPSSASAEPTEKSLPPHVSHPPISAPPAIGGGGEVPRP